MRFSEMVKPISRHPAEMLRASLLVGILGWGDTDFAHAQLGSEVCSSFASWLEGSRRAGVCNFM